MESRFEVVGVAELNKEMSRLSQSLTRKQLVKLMRTGATLIAREVRTHTPKHRGYLRRAVQVKTYRGPDDEPRATVGVRFGRVPDTRKNGKGRKVDAYYALFVHNGTIVGDKKRRYRAGREAHGGRGREGIKANPWVYEAFEATADRAGAKIINTIERIISE